MIKPNARQLNPRNPAPSSKWFWSTIAALTLIVAGCVEDASSKNQRRLEGIVVGDSMVPSFFGDHRVAECERCKFEMTVDLKLDLANGLACPNCGALWGNAACLSVRKISADEVHINPAATIDRWGVVAFERNDDSAAGIKRVIGLPGETIWFENGNVICQVAEKTRVLKKSLSDQIETRILVHDNGFQSDSSRWPVVAVSDLGSTAVPNQFRDGKYRWRKFEPKRCYEHLPQSDWTPVLEDNYGFNQGLARRLNPVNEVMLECDLPVGETGEVLLMISVGQRFTLARFKRNEGAVTAKTISSEVDGKEAKADSEAVKIVAGQKVICQLSNIDHQWMVGVNGQLLSGLSNLVAPPGDQAVAVFVGSRSASDDSSGQIRLWRDIYYFSRGLQEQLVQRQQRQAKSASGYFLIGDNLPISSDSRIWTPPSVSREKILGRVYRN